MLPGLTGTLYPESRKRDAMHDPMNSIPVERVLESEGTVFRESKTHARGPEGSAAYHGGDVADAALRQPLRSLPECRHGLGNCAPARSRISHSEHAWRNALPRTELRLRLVSTRAIGKWAFWWRRRRGSSRDLHAIPFAGACTDPCDGRTQGTEGMLDSLAYRNDAAIVLRRLMRSLPTRKGVIGVATCDKGLPAMMMALASSGPLPSILVPGGVTLLPESGEDAGKVQTIGARFAQNQITLEYAAEMGCRACATPGGGCQFLGTAATSQVVAEALGLSLPHAALAPSGQPIWLDAAARSARAMVRLVQLGIGTSQVLTDAAIRNAMVLHAAFGGSTNLLLHVPAVAHAAGLRRPSVADWAAINRAVPRLVDALPNGPNNFATVQVFLAGGVPEVMLHLRRAGLLDSSVRTVTGETLDANLNWWEQSERRRVLKERLRALDGIDAADVILSPDQAHARGLTATVCFPVGNLAPEGSVIKSTSIDPSLIDENNTYHHIGPARVFITEAAAIDAIKRGAVSQGDVIVLICGGPAGAGMQEIYQITSALKNLPFCKHVAVLTDARFSGVSTGACIGHISPEALAGGPIGRVREGDAIEIVIHRNELHGTVNLVGETMAARTSVSPPKKAVAVLPCAPRGPILRLTLRCPMTLASGPRSSRPAAECGAGAFTMWMRSFRSLTEALPRATAALLQRNHS